MTYIDVIGHVECLLAIGHVGRLHQCGEGFSNDLQLDIRNDSTDVERVLCDLQLDGRQAYTELEKDVSPFAIEIMDCAHLFRIFTINEIRLCTQLQ